MREHLRQAPFNHALEQHLNNYLSRQPANPSLFVATATGDRQRNDRRYYAIQNALNAAGANGGGIVYLPRTLPYKSSLTCRAEWNCAAAIRCGMERWRHNGIQEGAVIEPVRPGGHGRSTAIILLATPDRGRQHLLRNSYGAHQSSILASTGYPGTRRNVYAIGITVR